MIDELLQLWLDQVLATRRQRWVLSAAAVASASLATVLTTAGNVPGGELAAVLVATTIVATAAVGGSGTHAGSIVIAVVSLQWLAVVDDITSIRVVGAAISLYGFHALLALTASVRHTAQIDPVLLRRWVVRSVPVVAATVIVWLVVVVFERRDVRGDETLTILGLAAVAGASVIVRRASVAPGD